MFVIHLDDTTVKTLLLKILGIKIYFSRKLCGIHFTSRYLWAKYELIWTDFTDRTVILRANMLVQAKTIPQNVECLQFFILKVAFTQNT
jgi:hypothetical protein